MALQVWLPLNGTLENKGLKNVNVINNGVTVDNNGKIGKCYNFTTGKYLGFDAANQNNHKYPIISVASWIYRTSGSDIIECYENGGCGLHWSGSKFCFLAYINNNYYSCYTSAIENSKWYHVCGTYDGSKLSIYLNGELLSSTSISGVISYNSTCPWEIGGNPGATSFTSGNFVGKINDFRIYDHALSPKEVKEISKGLILHYKLDGNDIGITIPRNGGLIPDGVELYDYILSSGTLWIDTGAKFNAETDSCTVIFKGNASHNGMIFASSGAKYFWLYYYNNQGIRIYADNGSGQESVPGYIARDENKHTMKWENKHYIIDDVDKGALAKTYTETTNNIWLFAWGGGSGNYPFKGRIYYTNIKHNNQLIRNFLPCTYLGEPGMWDTVENKFYRNQGTGLFTLGNKITLKEYEYLLNDGNSYINTEYNLNTGDVFKFTYLDVFNNGTKVTGSSENKGYGLGTTGPSSANYSGGGRISNGTIRMFLNSNNTDTGIASNNSTGIYTETLDIKASVIDIRFESSTGTVYINKTINSATKNTGVMHLYRDSGTLFVYPGVKKIYKVTITKNNQLVRDFIPVSYNGTPGLWDKVEWKFYGNAGSGSFTLGPEKAVQQDAPVFYDSSGYCNHGTITGTLTTNSDSPRYTLSTVFSSYTNYITSSAQVSNITNGSVSFWFNPNSVANNLILMGQTTNLFIAAMLSSKIYNGNAGLSAKLYIDGVESPVSSTTSVAENFSGRLTAGWHHYCFTNVDLSAWTLFKIGNYSSGWPINGKLSDIRLYATALSEDDVKELYNTSAFVTNNGVFAEYELYEDNLSDVKKRGLLETANFYENGAESGYTLDTDKTRVASNYIISEDFIEI